MKIKTKQIAEIIFGMREAYSKGENAMRNYFRCGEVAKEGNDLLATLLAYDLQAGSYVSGARANPEGNRCWCRQLAGLLAGVLADGDAILEVGVGEATTLAGVLAECAIKPRQAFGFDVSWSRVSVANQWLQENGQRADLFVADLLNIPLKDNSIDVVYTSHSLEPNGGQGQPALQECLRVARKFVVLVEPIYELAPPEAQERMRRHGYVRGLRAAAEQLGAEVLDYRLLPYTGNHLNPSGVLCLRKNSAARVETCPGSGDPNAAYWRCPVTGVSMELCTDVFHAPSAGLVYPVLRGIPMLRAEHAIVASKLLAAGN